MGVGVGVGVGVPVSIERAEATPAKRLAAKRGIAEGTVLRLSLCLSLRPSNGNLGPLSFFHLSPDDWKKDLEFYSPIRTLSRDLSRTLLIGRTRSLIKRHWIDIVSLG